jgi:hypothetical protein
MIYYAFDKKVPTRRVMLLDEINWENDWPVLNGTQPSLEPQSGPVF